MFDIVRVDVKERTCCIGGVVHLHGRRPGACGVIGMIDRSVLDPDGVRGICGIDGDAWL